MKMKLNMNYTEYTFLCWHSVIVKVHINVSLENRLMRVEPIVLQEVCTTVLEHETPVEMLPCPVSVYVYASSVIKKHTNKSDNYHNLVFR